MRQIVLAVTVGVALCVMGAMAAEPSAKPAASGPATSAPTGSPEAQKVLKALDFWAKDQKSESVDTFMTVNWDAPMEFPATAHFFVMSEPQVAALTAAEREEISAESIKQNDVTRGLARETWRLGKEAAAAKDFAVAEKYYLASRGLGRLLDRPARMLIARMGGIGIERRTLANMIELYQAMNQPDKAKSAQEELDQVNGHQDQVQSDVRAMTSTRPTR